MKGTISVDIQDECLYFIAKLKHANFNLPIELIVYRNTIGDISAICEDQGEYQIYSPEGKFIPDKTWVAQPIADSKIVKTHADDSEGRYVEYNLLDHVDLNGYMDIEIRIYP